jgi:uncharacterized protein (DUF433 family)
MGDSAIEVRKGRGGRSAYIRGTRTRVSDIVRLAQALAGDSVARNIEEELPHLTTAQVESALAYWRAHREQIALEIAREEKVLRHIPSRA